jgi:thioesterase domain-containing protein
MGGVVAFEIARRLEHDGAEVALLILLDAPYTLPGINPDQARLAGMFLADATASLGTAVPDLPDPASTTAADQLSWLAERLGTAQADGAAATAAQLLRRFDVFGAHTLMLADYSPAAPAVRAPALIVSANRSVNAPARTRWPLVLGGPVSTVTLDADHYTFLRPPLVTDVGTAIARWHYDRVRRGDAPTPENVVPGNSVPANSVPEKPVAEKQPC